MGGDLTASEATTQVRDETVPGRVLPAAGDRWTRLRVPLPLYGALIYAAIRLLGLGVTVFLLPRGQFHKLHYSLWHLISSWDSNRYLIIAAHGYSYVPGNLRHDSIFAWLPGYPAAIDTVAWALGTAHAALCVTLVAGLAAAWGLTRLGMDLTGDKRVSLLMAALWAVAPGSIVLFMLYSEALFCALAVWALVAVVERRWLTAAFCTILAGTVRSTAMALVAGVMVAALVALIRAARARERVSAWWRPAAALLLAPLGLLGYWGYSAWALHHSQGWFWVEKNAHLSFDWGRSTYHDAYNVIITGGTKTGVPLTLLVMAAAVVLALCTLAERLPLGLYVYTFGVVLIAVATGPYYLGSKPRFLLPAVLLGLPLARLLARAPTWVLVPLIALLTAVSIWFGLYLMTIPWAP
jgi:hypothetical protein